MHRKRDHSGEFSRPNPLDSDDGLPPGHIVWPGTADMMALAAKPHSASKQEVERLAGRVAFHLPPGQRDSYMEAVRATFPAFEH